MSDRKAEKGIKVYLLNFSVAILLFKFNFSFVLPVSDNFFAQNMLRFTNFIYFMFFIFKSSGNVSY